MKPHPSHVFEISNIVELSRQANNTDSKCELECASCLQYSDACYCSICHKVWDKLNIGDESRQAYNTDSKCIINCVECKKYSDACYCSICHKV
jgi:hypothetical protein